MSHICKHCHKKIHRVSDIRNCPRNECKPAKDATTEHWDDDIVTHVMLGALLGSSFSSHSDSFPLSPSVPVGGGEFGGGGASGSWDDSSSSDSSSSSSSDSSNSDSGSSSGSE